MVLNILDSDSMKQCDAYTIEKIGVPSMVLMERAALSVTDEIEKENVISKAKVLVVAGTGNNGGDGIAIGRILAMKGAKVSFYLVGNSGKCSKETKQQISIVENMGYFIKNDNTFDDNEYDIIIDALFGIGLCREVEGIYKEAIQKINQLGTRGKVYGVDIPSGIHADTGKVLGVAVCAYKTITFQYPKSGIYLYPGCNYAGNMVIKDIGISHIPIEKKEIIPQFYGYEKDDLIQLPERKVAGNKGTFGRVLVVAGAENMAGAAYFSADSAYRSGCGLVEIFTVNSNRVILQGKIPEAVLTTYKETETLQQIEEKLISSIKKAKVIVLGPGLGNSEKARGIVEIIMKNATIPCVIDADALNILSENSEWLKSKKMPCIITPHLKELSRLCKLDMDTVKMEYGQIAKKFAKDYECIVVAKDARTIVTDHEREVSYLNLSGCNGMATAGSGDVLTGIIAGILAQKGQCYESACMGVYIHGLAGEEAAKKYGNYSMKAGNIIENIYKVCNYLEPA